MNESDARSLTARYTVRQNVVRLAADTPLRAQVLNVTRDVLPHDHDYYEICIVTSGSATHRTNGYASTASRGTVIVVPPGEVHAFSRARAFEVINVYYLTEWLLADLRRLWDEEGLVPLFLAGSLFRLPRERIPQFTLTREQLTFCQREMNDIITETTNGRSSLMYLRAAFVKLLIAMSRAFAKQMNEIGFRLRPQVWKALQYVERAVMESEPFSVEALSIELNASPDHAARLFKSGTGFSPMEYFQQRRVQHASLLLLNPDARITEVAYNLGFADAAHLSRMFRRYRGLSPREYRTMYVKGR